MKSPGFSLPKNTDYSNRAFDETSMNGSKYTKKSLVSAGKNSVESINMIMNSSGSL